MAGDPILYYRLSTGLEWNCAGVSAVFRHNYKHERTTTSPRPIMADSSSTQSRCSGKACKNLAVNRHVKIQAGWLSHPHEVRQFVAKIRDIVDNPHTTPHHHSTITLGTAVSPGVQRLKTLYNEDPMVRLYMDNMIKEDPIPERDVPNDMKPMESSEKAREREERVHRPRNVSEMLNMIDFVIKRAPIYTGKDDHAIACPLNALFDDMMATPSGFVFFRMKQVNDVFQQILNEWCQFLCSEDSAAVLNDGKYGWLNEEAKKVLKLEEIQCNMSKPHGGFHSWNDFFTRRFKEGARPVASPDDDSVDDYGAHIELTTAGRDLLMRDDIKMRDDFWIKSQPYSLQDMLHNDPRASRFVGGTIFQAFLSATSYHRWHSPVNGKVIDFYVVPGTYFSEAESEGYHTDGLGLSEGYLTASAARGIIFIECDDKKLGMIAIVYVGMNEVSSNNFTVKKEAKVRKGDQLGYFQFGGSTHCIIFEPNVAKGAFKKFKVDQKILLNSQLFP
ncbi:phosphatidylserine decarboxylase [Planoprotostelium fungivorum]|uniref:Phosphatidylserine decarboxylase n=1 Tax=Planoprotostelium fungivorum TaxID=1890364 RepID=A0A2P6NFH3_9EUKA|nr:phosphatidylserine decarboxylase [Planoprotostelium fungivorum]